MISPPIGGRRLLHGVLFCLVAVVSGCKTAVDLGVGPTSVQNLNFVPADSIKRITVMKGSSVIAIDERSMPKLTALRPLARSAFDDMKPTVGTWNAEISFSVITDKGARTYYRRFNWSNRQKELGSAGLAFLDKFLIEAGRPDLTESTKP